MEETAKSRRIMAAWLLLGAVLASGALLLAGTSGRFWAPSVALEDMPALELAAGLVGAGAVFLLVLPLIRSTFAAGLAESRALLAIIIGFGVLFRLILLPSTPAFEDDWYRYLWDGGVVASGYNPYAVSPDDAQGEPHHYTLQPLARSSGVVIERVNHAHLKTIYPPVAQASFALAHLIEPWSLAAWRGLLLACEAATLWLLLALLREAGRSPIWIALYWWNPVVVKEIVNSAHMEGIVVPLVLAALLLTVRARPIAAALALGLAIGAKVWPVMLVPLVLRPLVPWGQPSAPGVAPPGSTGIPAVTRLTRFNPLLISMSLLAVLAALWAWPILAGGLDQTSGFVAFAQNWRTNSAHFPVIERVVQLLLSGLDVAKTTPGVIVRTLLAIVTALLALWVARKPVRGAADLMARAGIVTGALFLLSPVQFPWYAIWMIPFLCVRPDPALLLASALVPIYYSAFYFTARDTHDIFRTYVVWAIWLPVWGLLAWQAWLGWRERLAAGGRARGVHA